jgi:hypothetical protein
MSNFDNLNDEAGRRQPGTEPDDPIGRLINLAGPRDAVPPEVERRVRARVRTEWRQSIVRRRTVRWSVPFALAASVLIGILVILMGPRDAPDAVPTRVASVARMNGDPIGAASRFSVGDPVYAGDSITTAGGEGISLTMIGGLSLRVAAETTVTIDSADAVTLETGRLYADSGRIGNRARHVSITTHVGSVTDRGTQFAVSYQQNELSIAVREGLVDVSTQKKSYTAETGERLLLQSHNAAVFDRVSKYDDSWDWAVALAPAFDIHNRSLHDFLAWAARETGKELDYASDDVRMAAMRTVLKGSVADFTPSEALQSVLPTTQFAFRIDEGQIAIGD